MTEPSPLTAEQETRELLTAQLTADARRGDAIESLNKDAFVGAQRDYILAERRIQDAAPRLLSALLSALSEQRAQTKRLREALESYGAHTAGCEVDRWQDGGVMHRPRPACDCGLDAVTLSASSVSSEGEDTPS